MFVFCESWFQNAIQYRSNNSSQNAITVDHLRSEETGGWDMERIIELLGNQACVQIIGECEPLTIEEEPARLVFKLTVHGEFSVKYAYNNLRTEAIQ